MSACPNDSTEEATAVFPPTYIVIQFSRHIRTTALLWLVDKICGKRLDGGAELLVRKQPHRDGKVSKYHFHLASGNSRSEVLVDIFFNKPDIKRSNI
jgi:anoctamin-10